ncbi:MAG: tRNA lysidine(34) synthetase TilS [Bacteroidales bacterium]|jgi:tRNA(Ile)-lysidine synthase|nr:tRNA lysidine(34) synthetase TilS [Bacteroidales bacterium]
MLYKKFLQQTKIFKDKTHLLVAVSGGADSVVLLHLINRYTQENPDYTFSIIHCNFKLRGESSFRDADFVEQLAKFYEVPLYSIEFNTAEYARSNSISIEMAARELRYDFFEKILSQIDSALCLLAHHKNDNVETFFLNLLRGTGLKGLRGMPAASGNYARPLLIFSKEEILEYAHQHSINYVQDQTNTDTVFLRNNIRHNIIPQLSNINDMAIEHISETMNTLLSVEKIVDKWFAELLQQVTISENVFSIKKIIEQEHLVLFLEMLLMPKNFSRKTILQIAESLQSGISGKVFYSQTHQLRRERETLVLEEIQEMQDILPSDIPPSLKFHKQFFHSINDVPKDSTMAVLDNKKITSPLLIRKWQDGDFFYPLGMNKKQKLSDFFNNNKFTSAQKENTWVLTHGEEIVWVVGQRISDKYKLKFPKNKGIEGLVINFL